MVSRATATLSLAELFGIRVPTVVTLRRAVHRVHRGGPSVTRWGRITDDLATRTDWRFDMAQAAERAVYGVAHGFVCYRIGDTLVDELLRGRP